MIQTQSTVMQLFKGSYFSVVAAASIFDLIRLSQTAATRVNYVSPASKYPASRVSFGLPRKIEGDSARRVVSKRSLEKIIFLKGLQMKR